MANKVMWYEVLGNDADKLQQFFHELFGWEFKSHEAMKYGMTDPENTGIGGGVGSTPGGASWSTFYVGVPDPQQTIDQALKMGGKLLMPLTELPDVTIAVVADPEGHPIGIVKHPC